MREYDEISALTSEFGPLTSRERALIERGVRGAEDPPAGEGAGEGNQGEGQGQGEGGESGAGDGAGSSDQGDGGEGNGEGNGDGSTEASIEVPELPGDPASDRPLHSVPEADLRALHAQYVALYQEHRPTASVAQVPAIETMVQRRQAIEAELQTRVDEAAKATARLGELDQAEPALPDEVKVPVLQTAAAVVNNRTAQDATTQDPPAPVPDRPAVTLQASAAMGVREGAEIEFESIGPQIDRLKRSQGLGRVNLASVPAFDQMSADEVPQLLSSDNPISLNDRLIRESVEQWRARRRGEPMARTAAVFPCEPFDIIRDIPSQFTDAERVSPIYPNRPAGRLGYTFTPSISLSEVAAGSTIWTADDQEGVDPTDIDTWKPCVEVECGTPQVVTAEAVTACLAFPITLEMSSPERLANAMAALMAIRARNKEGRILAITDALSSAYDFVGEYGALPAIIEALNVAIGMAVYNQRLDDPTYTLILDPVTARLLTIDRANRAYGVEAEVADVLDYVRASVDGIDQVVTTLDASSDGEPGLPLPVPNAPGDASIDLPDFNGIHRLRLVEPSAAIYAETGEMNVGVARSPEMLRQNRAQFFSEEFFMLEKHGPAPWFSLDLNLCADGARAGLLEPHRCDIS